MAMVVYRGDGARNFICRQNSSSTIKRESRSYIGSLFYVGSVLLHMGGAAAGVFINRMGYPKMSIEDGICAPNAPQVL